MARLDNNDADDTPYPPTPINSASLLDLVVICGKDWGERRARASWIGGHDLICLGWC